MYNKSRLLLLTVRAVDIGGKDVISGHGAEPYWFHPWCG